VKSKKSVRNLPVDPKLKERMLQIAGSEWIFSSEAGTPVDDGNALRRYIRPACVKLGIKLGGWHDFRHTLTTRLRKAHVHPRVLSDILGHSKVNLAMETYDRSDADDIATALSNSCYPVVTQNENPTAPMFILKELVSAEGIEPSTY
jgi:integrase